ncbi:oxidoreductase [Amycolatopsis taiwanensis]|uniref:oxidoreductase n=1 Tax=Amycolatopsis taiwanensis TaxID=342230 RepID=UPI000482646C|nr:oxidoreductase [Amycolatopsis taiwanensis]
MATKVCLVTGASSGIGHATALELLRAGHVVYGAARRVSKMEPLRAAGGQVVELDVTKEADVNEVVRVILAEQGRIDVLVNNAGAGLHGSVEEVGLDKARSLFDVNVFGPARLTQLVLPHLRKQGSGTVVNVSSIAGEIALPLGAWYYASKHALEAYSDTLRQELSPFGINVVLIQPGIIKTEFEHGTSDELREVSGKGAYHNVAEAMAKQAESQGDKGSSAVVVARAIRKAVESSSPKPRYAVGYLAKTILWMNRLLPDRIYDKVMTGRLN